MATFLALTCVEIGAFAESAELEDGEITSPLGGLQAVADATSAFDILFINGMATSPARAIAQATATGDKLGRGVRLIYNDLTLPVVDHFAIVWDKLFNAGASLNAATDTLAERIRARIESKQDVHLIGFSAGSVVANNAVRSVAAAYDDRPPQEKADLLRRIHVLTVGSAVFADDHDCADGWPAGLGSVFHLYDEKDNVAQLAGPADWGDDEDEAHAYLEHYLRWIEPFMLTTTGMKVVAGQVPPTKEKPAQSPSPANAGEADFNARLAYRHAPIHYQDVDQTGGHALNGKADYITAINFDGDWDTSNNWENIAKDEHKAAAVCYYSIVATDTHWFIVYAFYHPRDWTDNPAALLIGVDEHENDMEGLLAVVKKPAGADENEFGRLLAVVTVFHTDFFSYTPKDSPLKEGDEDIDGELKMEEYDGAPHPATAQEAKGHGLKAWPQVDLDGDGLKYFPSLTEAGVPTGPDDRNVKYKLVDIFAAGGLWERRENKETFSKLGTFAGGGANAPWGWDDGDDGAIGRGDMAVDPVKLAEVYFQGLGKFDKRYASNGYRDVGHANSVRDNAGEANRR